jgi:hypothetical protein
MKTCRVRQRYENMQDPAGVLILEGSGLDIKAKRIRK